MAITSNVFYPNRFTQDEQREIMRSPLWPLISGFHYKTEGKLFLSKVTSDSLVTRVTMSLIEGWPIVRLHKSTSSTNFVVNVMTTDADIKEVADTASISYILKRINDRKQSKKRGKKYPLGHTLHSTIERWTRASPQPLFYDMLEGAVSYFSRTKRGSLPDHDSLQMTRAGVWHAVRVAMGDTTIDHVSDSVRVEMQNAINAIHRREEMEATTRETITDMFDPDRCKWVVAYRPHYGYVVVKLRPTKLAQWCNNYVFPASLRCPDIMPSDIEIVELSTYYSTLRDLPAAHAAEILPRLNFAKVNRSALPDGSRTPVDPDGFIHSADLLQDRIGCITWYRQGYYMTIFDA